MANDLQIEANNEVAIYRQGSPGAGVRGQGCTASVQQPGLDPDSLALKSELSATTQCVFSKVSYTLHKYALPQINTCK